MEFYVTVDMAEVKNTPTQIFSWNLTGMRHVYTYA
jgi:hypothetical protein